MSAVLPTDIQIDLTRDQVFDDFTLKTFQERYFTPEETSPQQAFARAAASFSGGDKELAQRLYEYASKQWLSFATPLLSNGGTERGLPISCFLNTVEDSRAGILEHFREIGWLASVGGGIGSHWGDLRSNGEKTSKGSASTGVIPFIAVVDREILAFSQGVTRRGSYATYLDISHPEIEEFITMRKPTGGDQNRKATNLHNAVNITDEFMFAVRDDTEFHLRSPKTHEIIKTVRARDIWRLLIETRMQTGEPYMIFIDTMNRALPEAQKKLGLKVKQSNLCVAPYTNILTDKGYVPIDTLVDQTIEAWNGMEFSTVTVRKTADSAELIRVWFEDGDYIDCTPEHKFYLGDGSVVQAGALHSGMTLENHASGYHEIISMDSKLDPARSFTAGWTTFAGFEDGNRLTIYLPAESVDETTETQLLRHSVNSEADELGGLTIKYEPSTIMSGRVPDPSWSMWDRRSWLMGALGAAGDWIDVDGVSYYCLGSTDEDMIREMRRMALSIGIVSRIRLTDTLNAFMVDEANWAALQNKTAEKPDAPVIADIHPLPFRLPTYCATEPKRGRLCFNGYVTGNCTEITLPTGRDIFAKMRTAVCCLSSANAEKFDEWKWCREFLPDIARMLDNALDVFIATAGPEIENAVYSASRERSIGLGLLGFQAYLQSKAVSMESEEARQINIAIFQHLRDGMTEASLALGTERGEAPDMVGTGHRFAHRLAVAPNASSSILCGGTSPSIEPHRANAYLHKTLSGSFPVRNPQLVRVLGELGLDKPEVWQSIIANEGSVQQLDLPDTVKAVFKTATEIDQMALVRLAADRAPMICQAQSLNLFFGHDANAVEITRAHYRAWEWGVKSLYYLRSTTPKRAENTNKKVERMDMSQNDESVTLPVADEVCVACEG